MHWSLEFQSVFPVWLILLSVPFLGLGAHFLNLRDKNPSPLRRVLRFVAAFLLFLGISQLTLIEREVPSPGLALILDDSQSMKLPADSAKPAENRLTRAQSLADRLLPELQRAKIPTRTFRLSELSGPDQPGTPLGMAVLSTFRTDVFAASRGRERLAGLLLLTDGISTDGTPSETVAAEAENRHCALFPAVVGPTDGNELPQIYAEWLNPASTVLAGEETTLKFRVSALNLPENAPVSVRLKGPDGRTLGEKNVHFPQTNGSATLTFEWLPDLEDLRELTLETRPETLTPDLHVPLTVAARLRRVLLITAGPDWEFRNLRNLLAREPSIQLETWVPPTSPLAMDPEQDALLRPDFPSVEELARTDVVVFDSVSPQDLGAECVSRLRAAWLEEPAENPDANTRPRGLVLLAGRGFRPESWLRSELSQLLPVSLDGAAFQNGPRGLETTFTPAGWAFCVSNGAEIPGKLPPIYAFWNVAAPARNAQTLAELKTAAGTFPLVILGRSGRVSTLFHATDNSWRWRKNDDSFYRAYWVQTLHALCRNENPTENQPSETLEQKAEAGKPEEVTAVEKVPLEIPSQPVDFRRTSPDRETMAEWAKRSGGAVLDPEKQDAKRMAEEILLTFRARPYAPGVVETPYRFSAWPVVWVGLCLILGLGPGGRRPAGQFRRKPNIDKI